MNQLLGETWRKGLVSGFFDWHAIPIMTWHCPNMSGIKTLEFAWVLLKAKQKHESHYRSPRSLLGRHNVLLHDTRLESQLKQSLELHVLPVVVQIPTTWSLEEYEWDVWEDLGIWIVQSTDVLQSGHVPVIFMYSIRHIGEVCHNFCSVSTTGSNFSTLSPAAMSEHCELLFLYSRRVPRGGAEGARAPPFVSEGVLVKGANPRSFLERNLQFHTRIYCVHVLYLHDCRSTIAPRRRAIVKLIFVESRVSRLTIPYTCTRFSVLPGVTSNGPSRFRKSCTRAFSFMQTSAAAVRLHF